MIDRGALDHRRAMALAGGAVAAVAAGLVWYVRAKPHHVNFVRLQMAGSKAKAVDAVGTNYGMFTHMIRVDFGLIAGMTLGLVVACWLGLRVFWTPSGRLAAWVGLIGAVAAGVLNLAQDIVLLILLRHHLPDGDWAYWSVQALSFAKASAFLVAGPVAIAAVLTTASRLFLRSSVDKKLLGMKDAPLLPPSPREQSSEAERTAFKTSGFPQPTVEPPEAAHWRFDWQTPPNRKLGGMGICVSGGGIRSAAVTLGALQVLRDHKELQKADYLVSVSGGGYMTGALQLALQEPAEPRSVPDDCPPLPTETKDVFAPGSVEEDHLRRHSSYLSDGFGQWMVALGVALRGLLCSLTVIALTVAAVGLAIGSFYDATHIAKLAPLQPRFLTRRLLHPGGFPGLPGGITLAIAVVGGAALLVYTLTLVLTPKLDGTHPTRDAMSKWLPRIAIGLTSSAAVLALLGVVIPTLVWLSGWISFHTGWRQTKGQVAAGATASVILSYAGSLAATLWRKKATLQKGLGTATDALTKGAGGQVLPYSMAQMLLLWLCLIVISFSLFLISAWVASSGAAQSGWALVPLVALALVAALVDQTWFSMHPFYRKRLASAFAVRRSSVEGRPVAAHFRMSEPTPLSTYATKVNDFPQVIFAASANLTGQDRTPPGRRSVSYTFASDYVGGPQIGWVPTSSLEGLVSGRLQCDLTVEAAVAVSGAAFASAMGSQTRFYELFLTLANARLGAWLPNPYFVWLKHANRDEKTKKWDWRIPGLPDRRRLIYFAREIFGFHASTTRLLLCTDGGHYENLGLVELLRHRCKTIYCVDASGDSPPLATTLAQAITLAQEELGIKITPHDPLKLVPGAAKPLECSALSSLSARMSESAICVADIHYPRDDRPGLGDWQMGKLIVAKAVLTPDMPYELLSYAIGDASFPRDSTSDQWFNGAKFDAYQRLGQYLGEQAFKAARPKPAPPTRTKTNATVARATRRVVHARS